MNRINKVQNYINNIFNSILDDNEKRAAYIHSYGVAQFCALLVQKHTLNAEIATIIGLLHDVYYYKTGVSSLHSHNGAEMVRVAFKYELSELFSIDEQILIKSAIYHHSDKEHIHDEYDELLKDCDVLQHFLFDVSRNPFTKQRLSKVFSELNINIPIFSPSQIKDTFNIFNQTVVGHIAENLAKKKIIGVKENADYIEIIKYYPEEFAPLELDHAWCAAFVYHCCIEAGLTLPLRTPNNAINTADYRFACVVAWYEWGMKNGYCYFEKDGFVPKCGDILIYNNIIPKEHKAKDSTWCDHIGIVLSCNDEILTVAEGNVGNQNVSGIVERKRDETIGCYIRIPTNYKYDDWKIDYKTGKERVEEFI